MCCGFSCVPNGGVTDLGNLGGTAFDIALGINNRGQIVRESKLSGGVLHHAFLWQAGVMTDLGSLPGLPTSLANAINDNGQIVGFSQDAAGSDPSSTALIWQDGVLTDLNTLIPAGSPLLLKEALGINDRGQIAGYGWLADGEVRGFLLIPCHDNVNGPTCQNIVETRATVPDIVPRSIPHFENPIQSR